MLVQCFQHVFKDLKSLPTALKIDIEIRKFPYLIHGIRVHCASIFCYDSSIEEKKLCYYPLIGFCKSSHFLTVYQLPVHWITKPPKTFSNEKPNFFFLISFIKVFVVSYNLAVECFYDLYQFFNQKLCSCVPSHRRQIWYFIVCLCVYYISIIKRRLEKGNINSPLIFCTFSFILIIVWMSML